MDYAFILEFITKHPRNFTKIIKYRYPEFYSDILLLEGQNFSQKLYHWLYPSSEIGCKTCGKHSTTFISIQLGYTKYCSRKCTSVAGISAFQKKYGVKVPSDLEGSREKIRATMLKKYGVESSLQMQSTRDSLQKWRIKTKGTLRTVCYNEGLLKMQINSRNLFLDKLFNGDRLGYIEPMFSREEYINNSHKYPFRCKVCKTEFIDNIKWARTPQCKVCFPASKPQLEIYNFIKSLGITDVQQNTFSIIENRELDIYIPSKKVAIEFNGLYWHSQVSGNKSCYYHLHKLKLCNELGIRLIQIFEDEWENKRSLVEEKLKHIIGCNIEKGLYARNCLIKDISAKDANIFLENNHIQGGDKSSSIRFGLFSDNKLISVITFGKYRSLMGKTPIDGEFELIRYATSCKISGGFSKLLSHFIKEIKPVNIVSYADRRWSDGGLYKKCGFIMTKDTKPNYWYIKNGNRYYRYNFRKNILHKKLEIFDGNISEWENMKVNGYDRIWDCGSFKFELLCNK